MREHKQVLLANKAWAREILDEDADFFRRQSAGQSPKFLWIGCSDSRVSRRASWLHALCVTMTSTPS